QQLGVANINYRDIAGINELSSRKFSTWQTVIRYVSHDTHDSYSWVNGSPVPHYDKEVKFAFTEELPEFPTNAMVSVWPSWSNEDLTFYKLASISPNQFNATNFPFVNAWATDFSNNSSRKVYFGKQDDARFPAAPWINNMEPDPSKLSQMDATLDSIAAVTPLSGSNEQLPIILTYSGVSTGIDIGDLITVSTDTGNILDIGFKGVCKDRNGSNRIERSGLALINGEVIAYVMTGAPSGNIAELEIIGKTLLGSTEATNIIIGTTTIMRLPFGPVARLSSNLSDSHKGLVDLVDVVDIDSDAKLLHNAHSFLIMDANGTSHEMVQLVNEELTQDQITADPNAESEFWFTAPWLRGMYNTPVQSWSSNDLVLSWQARYASALPKDTSHIPAGDQAALLRSRSHAYISTAMRMFDLKNVIPEIQIERNPNTAASIATGTPIPAYDFEVRLLDTGFDWTPANTAAKIKVAPADNAFLDIPDDTTSSAMLAIPEGGDIEMRIHWRYNQDAFDPSDEVPFQLLRINEASNSAPSIQYLNLQGDAGIKFLDASAAR
ncbi:MAG: hypothetical protein HRU15_02410, partial [Planctomycetes bacterium]|nr:hypothetical protein [Planctomycetota bacterium]